MENHHFQWVNPLCLWSFSIATREKLPIKKPIYSWFTHILIFSQFSRDLPLFFSHPWGTGSQWSQRHRLGGPESLAVLQPHRDGDVAARCLGKEFAQLPQRPRHTLGLRCYPQSDGLYMWCDVHMYIYICVMDIIIYICLLLFILILHETSENNMDDLGVPIF